MLKQEVLKPQDIPVALRLAEAPEASFVALGSDLSMSPSTAHASVQRLQLAGLLRPDSRHVNLHFLMEFLEHGARYVFPAKLGGRERGVPTSYSAPPLAGEFISDEPLVWPDVKGTVVGQTITPLYQNAAKLKESCPSVYELLTLVDAIRIGRAREREMAVAKLKARLTAAA